MIEPSAVAERAQDELVQERAIPRRQGLDVRAGQPRGQPRPAAFGVGQDLEGETAGGGGHAGITRARARREARPAAKAAAAIGRRLSGCTSRRRRRVPRPRPRGGRRDRRQAPSPVARRPAPPAPRGPGGPSDRRRRPSSPSPAREEAADAARDLVRGPRQSIRPSSFWRIGASVACAWSWGCARSAAASEPVERLQQHPRPQRPQPRLQLRSRLLRTDGRRAREQGGSGVQSLVDEHGGDARLALAIDDGPMDRGRAPVAWQQARNARSRCPGRDVDDGARKDLSVGHDHLHLGAKGPQLVDRGRLLDAPRLEDENPTLLGQDLGRGGGQGPAATLLAIGLRHQRGDVMPGLEEGGEERTAKAPLPRKTTRTGPGSLLPVVGARLLAELALHEVPLQRSQAVDEQKAVDVVDLVAERARARSSVPS